MAQQSFQKMDSLGGRRGFGRECPKTRTRSNKTSRWSGSQDARTPSASKLEAREPWSLPQSPPVCIAGTRRAISTFEGLRCGKLHGNGVNLQSYWRYLLCAELNVINITNYGSLQGCLQKTPPTLQCMTLAQRAGHEANHFLRIMLHDLSAVVFVGQPCL